MKLFFAIILIGSHLCFVNAVKAQDKPLSDTATSPKPVIPNGPGTLPQEADNGQNADDNTVNDVVQSLSPLLSYNFSSGNKSFSGLTPIINYGWTGNFKKLVIQVNPYVAGQIRVKDSANFIPALMLPGIAGINVTSRLTFGSEKVQFLWFPFNFALKLNNDFKDSGSYIMQHNIRTGIGFRYTDFFQVSVQFTMGWHNLTSESAETYKKVFNKGATDISYVTVVMQTLLNKPNEDPTKVKSRNILFLEWRCLTNKGFYPGLPNNQILTIGMRKDFDLTSLLPPGATGKKRIK